MYAFTVGFKSGDTAPTLLYGPDTPVAKQDADLDRAARLDDGGDYVTVEIVYSNGRPKRRVDFTTPEQKAAINAWAAAALAKKEAAAQEQNEARIAALKAELAELEATAPAQPETDPDSGEPAAPDVPPAAAETTAAVVAPETAALEADAEAAENEDTAAPAAPADPAPKGTVSGKRPAKAA
jgi:hypothetical protein